ncbi:hypothetical protein K7W42_21650 [Deinococcus sp. HMF7604]|uniref:hypothetical protein n=1 Tax=Deinococcus betulae TaxID=2873312 RepID=UPI001CCC44C1|nr:hypothetical protein [Deinococcus betulae]
MPDVLAAPPTVTQPTNAQRLRDFHAGLGEVALAVPTPPDLSLLELRRTLITEEFAEVQAEFAALQVRLDAAEPLQAADLAPLAHELADLLYVVYGAFDRLGIDADAVFAEVHRANLGKLAGPRRADGKLLKPEGWQPADVAGVLAGQAHP